ncbi:MAG: glycosyltransferase family 2 protein [Chloroflexota bacterium]
MRFVVTLMVRDEVDIIAAMVEHHIDQGADLMIVTDNGSVDGTTEVLQRYADLGVVELHHDPVFRKQQHALVTGMARRAATDHGADWVINADADEFWVPCDKSLTLRSALEAIPTSLGAFTAPVTNLVGPPALRGSSIDRSVWRDVRTPGQLHAVGIYAHPTADAVHVGDPSVTVAQGNHFVSIKSAGQPDDAVALEVLHLPWRSWVQYERRAVNTGRSYEANPDLRPSKNHHMMSDYRRYLAGRLMYAYLVRLPLEMDLDERDAATTDGGFVYDPWLRDHLHALVDRALVPDLLARCLDTSDDEPIDPAEHERAVAIGRMFVELERERDEARRIADVPPPKPPKAPRLREEWLRLLRRTRRTVMRRLRRPFRGA